MKYLYTLGLWLVANCRPKVTPNKEAVMAYQHPELIRRLVEKYEMTLDQAEAAFLGMKQYLYLCGTIGGDLSPQSDVVDEAWHNFMMFSQDYAKFCFTHFGRFIHHQPFTKEMREDDAGQGVENTVKAIYQSFGQVVTPQSNQSLCEHCKCNVVSPATEDNGNAVHCGLNCRSAVDHDQLGCLIESNVR